MFPGLGAVKGAVTIPVEVGVAVVECGALTYLWNVETVRKDHCRIDVLPGRFVIEVVPVDVAPRVLVGSLLQTRGESSRDPAGGQALNQAVGETGEGFEPHWRRFRRSCGG